MNKLMVWMFCGLLYLPAAGQHSEKVAGIYLTLEAFTAEQISYRVDCGASNKKNKIRLNEFLMRQFVTVKHNGNVVKIKKDSIYAYKNCSGQVFRIDRKHYYLVLNKNEKLILYKQRLVKATNGRTNVTPYSFSIGVKGKLRSLTKTNLKQVFINNQSFLSAVDKHFKYNTDLAQYDESSNRYKINVLIEE